ncbi:MAG: hypothetical protein ABUL62_12990 [Myxococcales bacterium]
MTEVRVVVADGLGRFGGAHCIDEASGHTRNRGDSVFDRAGSSSAECLDAIGERSLLALERLLEPHHRRLRILMAYVLQLFHLPMDRLNTVRYQGVDVTRVRSQHFISIFIGHDGSLSFGDCRHLLHAAGQRREVRNEARKTAPRRYLDIRAGK